VGGDSNLTVQLKTSFLVSLRPRCQARILGLVSIIKRLNGFKNPGLGHLTA
jgi:hypothetical protein